MKWRTRVTHSWGQYGFLVFIAGSVISEVRADSPDTPLWGWNPTGAWWWAALVCGLVACEALAADPKRPRAHRIGLHLTSLAFAFLMGLQMFGWLFTPTFTHPLGSAFAINGLACGYFCFMVVSILVQRVVERTACLIVGRSVGLRPNRSLVRGMTPQALPMVPGKWTPDTRPMVIYVLTLAVTGVVAGLVLLAVGFWPGSPPASRITFALEEGWRDGILYPALRLSGPLWILLSLFRAIPIRRQGYESDMGVALKLRGPEGPALSALAMVTNQQAAGKHVSEWDADAMAAMADMQDVRAWNLLYSWNYWRGEVENAGTYLDQILTGANPRWRAFLAPLRIEAAFFEAFHRSNVATAKELLSTADPVPQFDEMMRSRAEAAIALAEGDLPKAREKASNSLRLVIESRKQYPNSFQIAERTLRELLAMAGPETTDA